MKKLILLACLSLINTVSLFGLSVAINNFSFEEPVTGDGTFVTSSTVTPSGWSIFGTLSESPIRHVGVLNPNGTTLYSDGAPHGNNVGVVFLNDAPFTNNPAGLEQVLSTSLEFDMNYTLTVDVGNIGNDPMAPHNAFDFAGFPGYRIELVAGNTIIASESNQIIPEERTFVERSFSVITTSAEHSTLENEPLTIRLINPNSSSGIEVNFDNVRLDATPVPEPLSALFLGLAVVVIAVRRRRA